MALTFNGTNSKLVGSNIVTGYPFAMFGWIRPANLTASQFVMGVGQAGGATEAAVLASGDIAGDPVRVFVRDTAGTSQSASSIASMIENGWQPFLAVYRSSSSRSIYFSDNSPYVSNTATKNLAFANFSRFVVGCRPISDTSFAQMDIAHIAVWQGTGAMLENDDWQSLRHGTPPDQVQPQALIDYWSLETQGATQTGVKGTVLTASNTAQASTSPTMNQAISADLPLRDGGGWCWFSDPRAVQYNGKTYVGWIAPNGSIGISQIDHATKRRHYYTLAANFEQDDHDNPSIYIRPDGRILVTWALHNDPVGLHYKISTNPEDITAWGSEQTIATPDGAVSYNNPRYLSSLDRLYQHFRCRTGATSTRPHRICYSDDDGATWSAPTILFTTPNHRPYVKSQTNGVDRIDWYLTQGNPGENGLITDVYHAISKVVGGELKHYRSDGTTEITAPITVTSLDKVYDSTASGVSGWVWDLQYGADGHPRVLMERAVSDTDNRYIFSRWDGSAWTTPVEICTAGPRITTDVSSEYTGGLCFARGTVDTVIASRMSGVGGYANLEKWNTSDNGANWAKVSDVTTDTTNGIINGRPYVPKDAASDVELLWWRGTYASYTDFDTDVFYKAAGAADTSLDGAGVAVATGTGNLTTGIPVAGAGTGTSSGTGALTTGIPLAGVAVAQATATGTITTGIPLVGVASAQSVANGDISTGTSLSGSAASVSIADGVLTTEIRLNGAALAQAVAQATFDSSGASLAGDAVALAAAAGVLTTSIRLNGAAVAQALASASLTTQPGGLAGAAIAISSASGELLTGIPLLGSAASVSSGEGSLSAPILLSGAAAGVSLATGDLTVAIQLEGYSLAQALASGTLTTQITLQGAALAEAVAQGFLGTLNPVVSPGRIFDAVPVITVFEA